MFHCVFFLVGMDGFLRSDERQRLAKERREEREKCLGKLCLLLFRNIQGSGDTVDVFSQSLRDLRLNWKRTRTVVR